MEYSIQDVVFELNGVIVALVQDYNRTGWPGLIVQYTHGVEKKTFGAPLTVTHAVQMMSFNFMSICKKLEAQAETIDCLNDRVTELNTPADVIPFKPKEV